MPRVEQVGEADAVVGADHQVAAGGEDPLNLPGGPLGGVQPGHYPEGDHQAEGTVGERQPVGVAQGEPQP